MDISPNTPWVAFWAGLFSTAILIACITGYTGTLADEKRHARDLASIEKQHLRDLARIQHGQCEVRNTTVSTWYPCGAGEGGE